MIIKHDVVFTIVLDYIKKSNIKELGQLVDIIEQGNAINPYNVITEKNKYLMWNEQCGLNFPILYLASIYLYKHAQERNCDTFLFATRDCCQWYRIFKRMYPHTNVHYFHCSRNMFELATQSGNRYFKNYVKSIVEHNVEKTIFIDIHGTGQRMFNYFTKEFSKTPHCFLLSAKKNGYNDFPKISRHNKKQDKFINLVFGARGSPIEMLNYDLVGTLQTFKASGPVRDNPEYNLKQIKPYHKCINYLANSIKSTNYDYYNTSDNYNIVDIHRLIKKIFAKIEVNKPIIGKYINHIGKHKKNV